MFSFLFVTFRALGVESPRGGAINVLGDHINVRKSKIKVSVYVAQIYKNIIKGFSKVNFPSFFPSDLTDTIKSLCRKNPEERITMQKGGVGNLKAMPFYSGLDWSKVAKVEAGKNDKLVYECPNMFFLYCLL